MFVSRCLLSIQSKRSSQSLVELSINDGLGMDTWGESAYSCRSMNMGDAILGGPLSTTNLICEGKSVYGLVGLPRSSAWRSEIEGKALYFGDDPQLKALRDNLVWKIREVRHV